MVSGLHLGDQPNNAGDSRKSDNGGVTVILVLIGLHSQCSSTS
jgi:hypothetical protein